MSSGLILSVVVFVLAVIVVGGWFFLKGSKPREHPSLAGALRGNPVDPATQLKGNDSELGLMAQRDEMHAGGAKPVNLRGANRH